MGTPPPLISGLAAAGLPVSLPPHPHQHITESQNLIADFSIRDFIASLAKAAYCKNLLKKTQIYKIIKAVKEGKTTVDQQQNNGRRKVRSPDFITKIAAEVEVNSWSTI